MTATQAPNGVLHLEIALSAPKLSSTGKTMLVCTDRAKVFATLLDGTTRELMIQLSAFFKP